MMFLKYLGGIIIEINNILMEYGYENREQKIMVDFVFYKEYAS